MNWIFKLALNQRTADDREKEEGAITVAETLIALGVGAAVLAAVFAGVPAVMESRNASNGLSGLAQAATSVRMTFGSRNNFNGLTTELASRLSGFPRSFRSGSRVIHPWGGTINVAGASDNFTITFNDLPTGACSSMVASSLELADSVTVGGTTVDLTATDDTETEDSDEGRPARIGELCSGSDIDVVWTFSG